MSASSGNVAKSKDQPARSGLWLAASLRRVSSSDAIADSDRSTVWHGAADAALSDLDGPRHEASTRLSRPLIPERALRDALGYPNQGCRLLHVDSSDWPPPRSAAMALQCPSPRGVAAEQPNAHPASGRQKRLGLATCVNVGSAACRCRGDLGDRRPRQRTEDWTTLRRAMSEISGLEGRRSLESRNPRRMPAMATPTVALIRAVTLNHASRRQSGPDESVSEPGLEAPSRSSYDAWVRNSPINGATSCAWRSRKR